MAAARLFRAAFHEGVRSRFLWLYPEIVEVAGE
jgi:hypothetical protein